MVTPVKRRFATLANHLETSHALNLLLQEEVKALKASQETSNKRRKGITVKNIGQSLFSTPEVLAYAQKVEAEAAAKRSKRKGKEKAVDDELEQDDSDDPLEENPFLISA